MDLESIIRDMAGRHVVDLELYYVGRIAFLSLTYEDFIPKQEMEQKLHQCYPFLNIDTLTRLYTDDAVTEACAQLFGTPVGSIDEYYEDPSVGCAIEEYLFNRTLD